MFCRRPSIFAREVDVEKEMNMNPCPSTTMHGVDFISLVLAAATSTDVCTLFTAYICEHSHSTTTLQHKTHPSWRFRPPFLAGEDSTHVIFQALVGDVGTRDILANERGANQGQKKILFRNMLQSPQQPPAPAGSCCAQRFRFITPSETMEASGKALRRKVLGSSSLQLHPSLLPFLMLPLPVGNGKWYALVRKDIN